jgi:hypothetical protein
MSIGERSGLVDDRFRPLLISPFLREGEKEEAQQICSAGLLSLAAQRCAVVLVELARAGRSPLASWSSVKSRMSHDFEIA